MESRLATEECLRLLGVRLSKQSMEGLENEE